MKTVSITRRVFLVAQPDSEVFVTELQYLCIRGRCTVLTPQQGDPAKKVKITRKTGLTALPGSLVNVSDNQYKRIKGACSDAYKVSYKYTGTVPSEAPAVPAAAYYTAGTTVTVAAAPTLEGYEFSGWSDTGTFTMPAEDVEITGSWTEAPSEYTVSYVFSWATDPPADPPEPPAAATYAPGETVTVAAKPSEFDDDWCIPNDHGWWDDEHGEEYEYGSSFTMPAHDITLDCTWTIKGELFYKWENASDLPDGAEELLPKSYRYNSGEEVTVAPAPTLTGQFANYTFDGWYSEEDRDHHQPLVDPDTVTVGPAGPDNTYMMSGILTPPN